MIGNRDLTKGEPWRVIVRFALPLLGAFLLQQLYNTVDMLVMGNFVGMGLFSFRYILLMQSFGLIQAVICRMCFPKQIAHPRLIFGFFDF